MMRFASRVFRAHVPCRVEHHLQDKSASPPGRASGRSRLSLWDADSLSTQREHGWGILLMAIVALWAEISRLAGSSSHRRMDSGSALKRKG